MKLPKYTEINLQGRIKPTRGNIREDIEIILGVFHPPANCSCIQRWHVKIPNNNVVYWSRWKIKNKPWFFSYEWKKKQKTKYYLTTKDQTENFSRGWRAGDFHIFVTEVLEKTTSSQVDNTAGAYRSFRSTKRLGVFLLPHGWDAC